jgi:hypothetical protein
MKTLSQIKMEAYKLYKGLELGWFFDTYHDTMLDLVEQIGYLEDDDDLDLKLGAEYLEQCRAIAKAQQILLKANLK